MSVTPLTCSCQRWQGRPLREVARSPELYTAEQSASVLDGFDVAYLQLLFVDILGVDAANLSYLVLPDTSSMYVALRAGDCDLAAAAVELDSSRALCPSSCPVVLSSATDLDYSSPAYRDRQRIDGCCLTYSVPHLPASGFALLSIARRGDFPLVGAIVSVEVLNVATPIVISMLGFGWLIFLLEFPKNGHQFNSQSAGIYFSFVSMATFGYGDLTPHTRGARLLTMFFTIFSVLSIATLTPWSARDSFLTNSLHSRWTASQGCGPARCASRLATPRPSAWRLRCCTFPQTQRT